MCRFIQYIVLYASFCAPYIRMLPEILNETILRLKPVINMPSGSNIDDLKKKDLGEAVYVLPKEYFSPKVFDSREVFLTPETHAIHHYQNSWFSHKAFAYYRTRTLFIKIFGYKAVRSLEKMLLKR